VRKTRQDYISKVSDIQNKLSDEQKQLDKRGEYSSA